MGGDAMLLHACWTSRPLFPANTNPARKQLSREFALAAGCTPCDAGAMAIRTLSSREVYRNQWMSVREDAIERSNGAPGIYGVVDKHDCAVILPIDGDHIWLVEQYRYTIGARALELPQGGWESEIASPEDLARGELREETGLLAGRMTELPWMWIAYGFARQRQHVFVAEELTPGPTQRDHEESDMQVLRLPIPAFEQKLRTGEIRDACTLAAWATYLLWRNGQR
jgi:ADP-ribose pyrophosphatase